MLGRMMFQPLLISNLIDHAERYHADTAIISKKIQTAVLLKPTGPKSQPTLNDLPMCLKV